MTKIKDILTTVEKGLEFVEEMLPLAHAIPGVAIVESVVKVAGGVSETLRNIQARGAEAGVVIDSKDQKQIQEITERLAAVNDGLMRAIAAS